MQYTPLVELSNLLIIRLKQSTYITYSCYGENANASEIGI